MGLIYMISEPKIIFRPSLGSNKSRTCKQFLLVYHTPNISYWLWLSFPLHLNNQCILSRNLPLQYFFLQWLHQSVDSQEKTTFTLRPDLVALFKIFFPVD